MRLVQIVMLALVFIIGSTSVWAAKPVKDSAEQPGTAKAHGKGKKTKVDPDVAEPIAEPVEEEPIVEVIAEPIVVIEEEPIVEVIAEPVVDPIVAEPIVDPVIEEPIVEVIDDPVAEPVATYNNIILSWVAPATRENGEALALSAIAGYEIYYTSDRDRSSVIVIDGGQITEHSIDGLAADTFHFSISTIDIGGLKSEMSEVISISLE